MDGPLSPFRTVHFGPDSFTKERSTDSDYLGQASDKNALAILICGISEVPAHLTCAIFELDHHYGSTVL